MRQQARFFIGLFLAWWMAWESGSWALAAGGSQRAAAPPYRIVLALYRGVTPAEQGFMDYLRDRKVPVQFLLRDIAGEPEKIAGLRAEIRELQPDLVYSFGTTLTLALAGRATEPPPLGQIPIVFNIVADPVGAGLIARLAGSGRNLTGTTHTVPLAVQYQTLRQALDSRRIGLLYNPAEVNAVLAVTDLEKLARQEGLTVVHAPLEAAEDPQARRAAVARLVEAGVDVFYLPSDSSIIQHARSITTLTDAAGVPTFSATEGPVRHGGATLGLISAYYNVGQLAAFKALQILREGRDPGTLPIEGINRFAFVVNVRAARRLNRFPPIALLRIAELICLTESECPDTPATDP